MGPLASSPCPHLCHLLVNTLLLPARGSPVPAPDRQESLGISDRLTHGAGVFDLGKTEAGHPAAPETPLMGDDPSSCPQPAEE